MNRFQNAKCAMFLVAALLVAFAVRSAASEFKAQLQLKEGVNITYLPLHDDRASSVGKLRELLGGGAADAILLLNQNGLFELARDEAAFSPSQAFIAVMKQATTVEVQGTAHPPVLNLREGLNIAVVPRRSQDIRFMSDIAGLSDAIDTIVYASDDSGLFQTYPPYDQSLSGGVSFFVIANRSASIPFLGEPWGNPVVVSDHLAELLEGVEGIGSPGLPGPLSLIGENVFPVAAGKTSNDNDNNIQAPVVGAAFIGNGRAVAFGHDGYLSPVGGRLLLNAARWAAAGRSGEIGVVRLPQLARFLNDAGLKTAEIDDVSDADQLNRYAAVCVGTHIFTRNMSAEEIRAVRAYVDAGGGLVTAGLGWGWLQLNPGKTIQEHPGNQLLGDKGILWGDGFLYKITPQRGIQHLNVLKAMELLQAGGGTNEEKAQAAWLVNHALRTLPYDDKLLRPKIVDLAPAGARTYPRPDASLTPAQAGDWIALTNEITALEQTPPQEIEAHPAAKYFPGEVPSGAATETAVVPVPLNIHGWRSTGLYAAPGALIEINVADSAIGIGLKARIGAHTDTLWHKTEWRRAPQIATSTEINAARTFTANAFGGLVYIDAPPNQPARTVNVTIKGAVLAPHYILDETNIQEWRSSIRNRPGPWAELETDRIVLTVPSSAIRSLDNPYELMRFWRSVVEACADLASEPAPRTRPERIVPDTQISAGYMHSGYPIMTHMDVAERSVNLAQMLQGSWGHFHELGHNFQSRNWTFDGAGEVTVNLFTLYVYETVCGIPLHEAYPRGQPHDAMAPELILQAARQHAAAGAPFDKWKSDPFLALKMYAQMIKVFGYDPFKRVFAGYSAPIRNDNEKRDQWMTRFSNQVGRNLGPFFQAWGVPTSSGARASIQHLPVWLPAPFDE